MALDVGDLELIGRRITDAVEMLRLEFPTQDVDRISMLLDERLQPIYDRLTALETAQLPVEPEPSPPITEVIAAEAEAQAEIIRAEGDAEAVIIEAQAEAAVAVAEAVAENDVIIATEPEPEETLVPPDDELPEEMSAIIAPDNRPDPEPKRRGGFWNTPIFGGGR